MKLPRLLFSFKGRVSRQDYWIGITISGLLIMPALCLLAYDIYNWLATELHNTGIIDPLSAANKMLQYKFAFTANILLGAPFIIASFWSLFAVTAKRFHDLSMPGWFCIIWVPLTLMPGTVTLLLSFIVPIVIGCLKGTVGTNKYGSDPLEK